MSRSAMLGLFTLWLVAACEDPARLVHPREEAPRSGSAAFAEPDGDLLGTFTLDPPQNHASGTPATSTGIVLPSGVALRVTVSGTMTFDKNPAYKVCFGQDLYPQLSRSSVGPSGFPPAADFGVSVGQGSAAGIQPGAFQSLTPRDFSSDIAGIDLQGGGGILWVRRSGVSQSCGNTPAYLVSGTQTVRVRLATPSVVIMASVQTYLAKSFTGKQSGTPDESAIKLHAEVTPAELAPGVKWEVKADPGHYPNPPNVNAEPTGGDAVFTVTPLTPDRWPRDHEQSRELLPKQFSYVFTASVQDAQGQTHRSNEETATQDEIDTIREEYVEFGRHDPGTGNIPVRDVFQRKTSDHFKVWELNSGDYSLYWVQDVMLKGLERMRDMLEADYTVRNLDFSGFVLSSAFRNPVHHRFHTDPDPRNELTNDSPHQYGLAADIKIDNQPIPAEAFFEKLNWLAKYSAVGACFEPKVSITNNGKRKLDHAHVDWRNRCGSGWR